MIHAEGQLAHLFIEMIWHDNKWEKTSHKSSWDKFDNMETTGGTVSDWALNMYIQNFLSQCLIWI